MIARYILLILFFFLELPPGGVAAQQLNFDQPKAWEFEGEYEVKLDFRKNFALDKPNREDLFRFDQELQLRGVYRHKDWISALLEAKVFGEHQLYTGGRARRSEVDLERGETWIRFDQLFGRDFSLKVGRQNFDEPRKWWWDDDLDAIGLRYRGRSWLFEFAAARDFVPVSLLDGFIDPENQGVTRVLARANWRYLKNHALDLFLLHQNDRSARPRIGTLASPNRVDPSDARLWWSGLRASGDESIAEFGALSYWADAAVVSGKEKLVNYADAGSNKQIATSARTQRVRGWAIDLGIRWDSRLPAEPLFTLGYAVGSGDKHPERGSERAFRQTGLQSNDEEFRTYGEILRPELSNLSIPVVAVRFPIFSKSYVEFAYRHFRQLYAAPFLRDGRIESDPNGARKTLGQEWMLYSLLKQWKNVEIELVGAAFRSGNAYGELSGKTAYSLFTQVTWEF